LLLQLSQPLYLHGKVVADLFDLTFDGVGQFRSAGPPLFPTCVTRNFRFRHRISPLKRDLAVQR
jgi:hypothetical protein